MNGSSSMILIGVGGAGCGMAQDVARVFGDGVKLALLDTDAASGGYASDGEFLLLGGDRLSGRGSGGDIVGARLAAEDSAESIDAAFDGARLAVAITCLGGGTGGGATLETLKRLSNRGIPSIVFATTPFAFEGEKRLKNARGIMSMIEDEASASFFLPLDKLVGGEDNMNEALARARGTMASAVSVFWRLVEKPGYIKLDAERLRQIVSDAGRGRFAVATARGQDRAKKVADSLLSNPLLADGSGPVKSILCGVLAGDDLRLGEISEIADTLKSAFGDKCAFDLATVNDEENFSGSLSVVAMMFETAGGKAPGRDETLQKTRHRHKAASAGSLVKGKFKNAEPTVWNGENLDIPTYVRKNINLGR